ncbi:MAG: enoyl-CoA hydratase/isomerase family protein [Myxococcota bacterium]
MPSQSRSAETNEFSTLLFEKSNSIGRITLNRPAKRNALSPTMAEELTRLLQRLEDDREVRVVSIRGAEGQFCSGGDLAPDEPGAPAREGSAVSITLDMMNRIYGSLIRELHRFPKPVIALVEGVAAGAGANLAFVCDFVYATPSARFSEIFVKRGIALDCGGSWILPRLIGLQKAKELAFFGDWIPAEEAHALGLVTTIYPEATLAEEAEKKLQILAGRPPLALAQIKQSLHRATTVSMNEALEIEAVAQAMCTASDDCAEGMLAFMEKREPVFKGS